MHKTLGPGFLESVYHNALKKELEKRGIKYESVKRIEILYDGDFVGEHIPDFIINNELIVELRNVTAVAEIHKAQVLSYLRATGLKVGLVINFANSKVETKRVVNDYDY